jgi:hypothetical protein
MTSVFSPNSLILVCMLSTAYMVCAIYIMYDCDCICVGIWRLSCVIV